MKKIELDGTNWKTSDDFYDAFFRAFGSPPWHGRNFNALRDSIATGHINQVELPYVIHISGVERAPTEIRAFVAGFCDLITELRSEGNDVDVVCPALFRSGQKDD
jgi:RNAse (barnase) inhibitor barstar